MAVTQQDVDNLNAAIVSGTRSVTLGGQTITYSTVDALIAARNDQQEQLNKANAAAAGQRRRKTSILTYGGRGFSDPRCSRDGF